MGIKIYIRSNKKSQKNFLFNDPCLDELISVHVPTHRIVLNCVYRFEKHEIVVVVAIKADSSGIRPLVLVQQLHPIAYQRPRSSPSPFPSLIHPHLSIQIIMSMIPAGGGSHAKFIRNVYSGHQLPDPLTTELKVSRVVECLLS